MTEQEYVKLLIEAALCAYECNLPEQCVTLNEEVRENLKKVEVTT